MTDLLVDGLESNNFEKWTNPYYTSGETAAPSTEQAHHGSYSAKFASNGSGGTEYALLYNTEFNANELYARCYVKVTQSGIADDGDNIGFILFSNAAQNYGIAGVGWRRVSGAVNWYLMLRNGANYYYSTAATRNLNEWYCVELYAKVHGTSGAGRVWVNGSQILEQTGMDTDDGGNVGIVSIGLTPAANCTSCTDYVDCIVVADAYVGPEEVNNLTVKNELLVPSNAPSLTKQQILQMIWDFDSGKWLPHETPVDLGTAYIRLKDNSSLNGVNIFLVTNSESNYDPLLVVDQGAVLKKDLAVGGYVASEQGTFAVGHGLLDQLDPPKIWLLHSEMKKIIFLGEDFPPTPQVGWRAIKTTDNKLYEWNGSEWVQLRDAGIDEGLRFASTLPQLQQTDAGTLYIRTTDWKVYEWTGLSWDYEHGEPISTYDGYFDTLYIRKADCLTPGHLDLGNLSVHGHLGVGDTVTSDLNPNAGLSLGNLDNKWLAVVAETGDLSRLKIDEIEVITPDREAILKEATLEKKLIMKDPAGSQSYIENHVAMLQDPEYPAIFNPVFRTTESLWAMKDISCLGFLGTASPARITFGATYTACIESDIGKEVKDDGARVGVLGAYDNTTKIWWISADAGAPIANGSSMTITSGTGAGTTNTNAVYGGGGAIQLGHGFVANDDEPHLTLSDTGYDTLYLVKPDWAHPGYKASQLPRANLVCYADANIINSGILAAPRGGLGKALSPTWTNDYVLVYKAAPIDQWQMEPKGVPSAHASTHEYNGTDMVRNLDYLKIRDTTVITSTLVLQSVTANASIITSGTFGLDRIPTIPYSKTNFADQNLLQTSDAIFNSVKGNASAGAVKAGNEITLAWDTNYSHITSHSKHLQLGTSEGKEVYIPRNLHVGGSLLLDAAFSPSSINCTGVIAGAQSGVGGYNGQAFKIGDDVYLCDRNIPDGFVIEGATSTNARIVFGSGLDTNLYRGGANQLKTDDDFVVGGTFYCNNDMILNNDPAYAQKLHQTVRTVMGVTAGVVRILQDGSLSSLDASNIFADHLNSASGGGITIFDYIKFEPALDQIRFAPSGYNSYYWMYKPSDSLAFAVYDASTPAWRFKVFTDGTAEAIGVIKATGYFNTAPSVSSPSRSLGTVYQNTTGKTILVSVTLGLVGVGSPFYTRALMKIGSSSTPDHTVWAVSNSINSTLEQVVAIVPSNWYYKVESNQNTDYCWIDSTYTQGWKEQSL